MSGIAQFRTIVFDCPDPKDLRSSTRTSSGGRSRPPRRAGWWSATAGRPGGWPSSSPDHQPPVWPDPHHPQQIHLDLDTDDMDEAEAQAIKIGARKHEHQPCEEDSFRVFLDPAGHPFCLCRP